jgi:hypothetical protein
VSDNELKYPAWQVPLQDVILEFNLERLPGRIQQVETLIFERLQELQLSNDGAGERQAINDGLDLLRTIKRERLDFPEWQ